MRMFWATLLMVVVLGGCAGRGNCPLRGAEREWPDDCATLPEPDRDYCLEARSKTQPPEGGPVGTAEPPEEVAVPPTAGDSPEPPAP